MTCTTPPEPLPTYFLPHILRPPPFLVCGVKVLMTANFIGVACARSMHFQFYSWYWIFYFWEGALLTHVCWLRYGKRDLDSYGKRGV
jgi:hypothetical protein